MPKRQRLKENSEDLEPKQELFCQHLVASEKMNQTRAYMKAFDTENRDTAAVQASVLLRNHKVKARVDELMKERAERLKVKADDVLRELQRIGYSDTRKVFNKDGTVKHPSKWPTDLARAIASIEVDETFEMKGKSRVWTGYVKKVRFWPKVQALELLGKHLVLFTDKIDLHDKTGVADKLARARKRREGNK
jgi:phage terminase small subunit